MAEINAPHKITGNKNVSSDADSQNSRRICDEFRPRNIHEWLSLGTVLLLFAVDTDGLGETAVSESARFTKREIYADERAQQQVEN